MAATKKVKVKKLSLKRVIILLLILYLVIYSLYYVFKMPIKNIYIKGTNLITDNEIISAAHIKNYPSIFKTTTLGLKKNIKKIPLVKDVKIRKSLLGKLTIEVEEYKILFYNLNNKKIVLDDEKEIDDTSSYKGVPTLINYVPDTIYAKLIKSLLKVDSDILSSISEIEYSPSKSNLEVIDDTRFILRMNDTNTVYANLINIKNLNHYDEIYSTLNNQKGYLYLDSSNEENFYFQNY